MLGDKQIDEAKRNAIKSINKGEIIKTSDIRYTDFFVKNSKDSSDSAKALFEISTNEKVRELMGFSSFNGFLWVINASYYSMFYIARALLESIGVKIKTDESIHFHVFNALVYYFYSNGKLERHFIEDFQDAGQEASQALGKEKAKGLIEDYSSEKEKRSRFTYEMGEIALKNKAETSLSRAKKFNEEIRKLLKK
ncbi:hypothetical protein A3K73_03675 [Candidatus Pacearchaeota archaeon RBG_13_36_9]|nr:MAG: hypothetical protein A3K73_03675 [Candidatus Pacearchaeota archaeon RBG_13_36_9]HJX50343.1 hypothetical protein [Candidatus Nanoarchaeia archaeon]